MNLPAIIPFSLIAAVFAATPIFADNAFANLQTELTRGDVAHNEAKTFFKGKQKENGCASAATAMQHFKTVAWYADGMDNAGGPSLVKKANSGIKDVSKLQKKKKCSITT